MRKRLQLVQQKTSHILSFKNLVSRNLGFQMSANDIKKLTDRSDTNQMDIVWNRRFSGGLNDPRTYREVV